jgi:hypothetical protein
MTDAVSALNSAIQDADRLTKILKKDRTQAQVRSSDERALAKASAQTWFRNYRPAVTSLVLESDVAPIDLEYRGILEASERAGSRAKYLTTIKALRQKIIRLRSDCLAASPGRIITVDMPPDFSPLVSDPLMREILVKRWSECVMCLGANASLAATVMMGGLLEAILLARINKEPDKTHIFKSRTASKESTGKTRQLKEWGLSDYINVVHELKWVSVSVKDVGDVLRDYRNYIHPYKQLSRGVHLETEDAGLFWEVTKNITRQVINNSS